MIGELLEGGLHIGTLPDGRRLVLSPKSSEKKIDYGSLVLYETMLSVDDWYDWKIPDADILIFILQHYNTLKSQNIDVTGYEFDMDCNYWTVNEQDDTFLEVISVNLYRYTHYGQIRCKRNSVHTARTYKFV